MKKQLLLIAAQARLSREHLVQLIHADPDRDPITQAHVDLLKLRIEQSLTQRPQSLDALLARYGVKKAYLYPDGAVGIPQRTQGRVRRRYFQWFKWSSHSGGFVPRNKYPRWSLPDCCTLYQLSPTANPVRPLATPDQVAATMTGSNIRPRKKYRAPSPPANKTPGPFRQVVDNALNTHLQVLRVTRKCHRK